MSVIAPLSKDFNSISADAAATFTYEANKEAIQEAIEDIDELIAKRSKEGRTTYVARNFLTDVQRDILIEYYENLGYKTEKVYTNTLYVKW